MIRNITQKKMRHTNNRKTKQDPDETEKTIDYESLHNCGMFFLRKLLKQSETNRAIKSLFSEIDFKYFKCEKVSINSENFYYNQNIKINTQNMVRIFLTALLGRFSKVFIFY